MVMDKWKVEYGNHTCVNDDGFFEFWEVSDGETTFTSEKESDAVWLCNLLNSIERPDT